MRCIPVSYTHLDVYKRQGLYPVDIRDELIYNNCVDDYVENVRSKDNNDIIVSVKVNGCVGNELFYSGAQVSLINETFINKHKHQFKKTPILPVNNTIVTTAIGDLQTICKQVLITICSQGMEMEVPVLIVKGLVYDVILGTDTLRKIHTTVDFTNKTLNCIIQNKNIQYIWVIHTIL